MSIHHFAFVFQTAACAVAVGMHSWGLAIWCGAFAVYSLVQLRAE